MMLETDYLIIGAGSAGSVVANRLSADDRTDVTVLEAGPTDLNPWIYFPLGYGHTHFDPAMNWRFESDPIAGLMDRKNYVPRGKVLGGSSSINALVYSRGHPDDFNEWRAEGNQGWGWPDVLAAYKRIEDHYLGASGIHGVGGPLTIRSTERDAHPLCARFLEAGRQAGFRIAEDLNDEQVDGVGYYQLTLRGGFRMSASRAFLRPVMRRQNLRVETKARVIRLLLDGRRATGARYVQNGQTHTITARREVILSGGAICSPQLLQLSGIGPASRLQHFGIPVVVDLPAVGEHMQDHICYDHYYRSRVPTLNPQLTGVWGRFAAGLDYVLRRRGPLSISLNQAGGYVRSRPSLERPDMQVYFCPISYAKPPQGSTQIMALKPDSDFSVSISPCRPTSRGYVRLRSSDPLAAPAINPNFLDSNSDVELALAGARLLRRFAAAPALAGVIEAELQPGPSVTSDQALIDNIRRTSATVFHPVSSCRMGPDPRQSAVDSRLRVHGIAGLRVIDASIFPSVTSGNTNAPAIMVGEMGARFVLEDAR